MEEINFIWVRFFLERDNRAPIFSARARSGKSQPCAPPLRRLSGAFNAWVNKTASFDPNCCLLTSCHCCALDCLLSVNFNFS